MKRLFKTFAMHAIFLAFLLSISQSVYASDVPTEQEAYNAIMSLKSSFPEGMTWTNDNYYAWKGGIYRGGYGCAGFAFRCSDEAFGSLPARKVTGISIADVHVGDILRINNDSHSVVVTEIYADYVVLCEGNYNSSIHWGRQFTSQQVAASDYLITRYPVGTFAGSGTDDPAITPPTSPITVPKESVNIKTGDKVADDTKSAKLVILDVAKKEVAYTANVNLNAKTVTIPATIKVCGVTYKITKIEDKAFKGNKNITKLTVGSNITSIGKEAFSGCKKIKTLKITSKNLTSKTVAKNAFRGLTKATTIKVPKKKLQEYRKLFKKKGLSSKVKVMGY